MGPIVTVEPKAGRGHQRRKDRSIFDQRTERAQTAAPAFTYGIVNDPATALYGNPVKNLA
jgi:hypothetical protein